MSNISIRLLFLENKNNMKKVSLGVIVLGILISVFALLLSARQLMAPKRTITWNFQSIDTMKYSRDLSREKLSDVSFSRTIEKQVKEIADTGATHVAIATPYDEEFYPMLKRWVDAARKNNLKVWFRGNFSGWEGWFSYPKITRQEHLAKTKEFLTNHMDIFKDGDVFTPCPECENGGPGDPRQTGDIAGHRQFLIEEYDMTSAMFAKSGKNVVSNFDSMNADIAKAVMDAQTTKALGGVVTIDHYVRTAGLMDSDINFIAQKSGGKIVMGEIGAPIPDITGDMTSNEQAAWLSGVLKTLSLNKNVIGVNYWVGEGGSTELWDNSGNAKKAVGILQSYYKHQ